MLKWTARFVTAELNSQQIIQNRCFKILGVQERTDQDNFSGKPESL